MRPILEYGSSVWDPHYNCLNDEFENVQKRAARYVMTRNYSHATGSKTDILEELKWETLQKRNKDNRLILMYECLEVKPEFLQVTLSKNRHSKDQNSSMAF